MPPVSRNDRSRVVAASGRSRTRIPRPYLSEVRERALELTRSGRTSVDVAATLWSRGRVPRWMQQDLVDRGLKPTSGRAPSASNKRIREAGLNDAPQTGVRGEAEVAPQTIRSVNVDELRHQRTMVSWFGAARGRRLTRLTRHRAWTETALRAIVALEPLIREGNNPLPFQANPLAN